MLGGYLDLEDVEGWRGVIRVGLPRLSLLLVVPIIGADLLRPAAHSVRSCA